MSQFSSSAQAPQVGHAGARYLGPHTGSEPLEVTVVLRRRPGAPVHSASWPHAARPRRDEFAQHCGADPQDLRDLRDFARAQGLRELSADPGRRVLHLVASPQTLERAFNVRLGSYQSAGAGAYVGCDRAPAVPPGAIAVLGLDRRPIARMHLRKPRAAPIVTYTPLQLGQLYRFPDGADGGGETIALVELGGGFSDADLAQYFARLGIAQPPGVTAVSVAGAQNQPGGDADAEVMLDIEVAGALAPAAAIAVYFAPNTERGFFEAVSQAAHDTARRPAMMSISWGAAESDWSAPARDALQSALQDAAALGVTVMAAAGDSGSADGQADAQPHVDFPASSPFVLACGGTRLLASAGAITSEVVWNESAAGEGATGGGVSAVFALPSWQSASAVPRAPNGSAGRGVPDVAGNADPLTGYQVFVHGQPQVIGGTSAVAPLWAALIARCNQKLGAAIGDAHAGFYGIGPHAFRDITLGDNGAYRAAVGWDPCTGLGSPDGQALLLALASLKA